MIIPVLPQTPFNYSYLVTGATEDVIVADKIPVPDARTIALSVRIHELNLDSGAGFRFLIYGVDPSQTDGTVFITSTAIGDTGAITSATPNLVGLTAIISDPVYPFVRVVLQAVGPTATGTTYGELSADLIVRQAAPAMNRRATNEAAFAGELLRALYEDAPQSNGMLSEFAPRPSAAGGCFSGLAACSMTISCPGPKTNHPQPPAAPTESWICHIVAKASELYHCN